jgi:hypothetical protein
MSLTPAGGGTLAAAQAEVQAFFDQSGTVWTHGWASNGAGGLIASYTAGATVACIMRPSKRIATETLEAGATTSRDRWDIGIPVGTTISTQDRFEVDGIFYEVLGHDVDKSYPGEIILDCLRVDDGSN